MLKWADCNCDPSGCAYEDGDCPLCPLLVGTGLPCPRDDTYGLNPKGNSPRVQVTWVDHDEHDGDLHETGWIRSVEGDQAVIDCDCGPRIVRRPLAVLTLCSQDR